MPITSHSSYRHYKLMALLLPVIAAAQSVEKPVATRPATQGATPAASLLAAQRAILIGDYDVAEACLRAAITDGSLLVPAALAAADIDERLGRYRIGITRLDAVAPHATESADWHAARASLRAEIGEYEDAVKDNEKALSLSAACIRARYQLGRLHELFGRTKDAIAAYKWFDDVMKRKLPDRADELTYLGRGFIRYSTLTRNPDMQSRTKHVLQEVFQEAFDFVDSQYWPARLAAAELLMEKHNAREAEEDFKKVLETNPRAFEAELGLARVALENWNFELADKHARAALRINPNSVAARIVLAQVRMSERRYGISGGPAATTPAASQPADEPFISAVDCAESAIVINPRSVEALSILAAAQLRHEDLAASKIAKGAVYAINPRPAWLHHTLGVWLSAARQYDDAEANFKKAIEFAPWWSEPRIELGLMCMQSGDERAARETLDACQAMDPYNMAAFNTLALLDELEAYARHETEHFVFRFQQEPDGAIIPTLADYCERMQAEVCAAYGVTLKRKTIIEVFPTHGAFSVRITGRPWIHTVGACTGCVIAIDAPRKTPGFQPFNWAEVLRHEFTHTVTLAATENRIPHWMTEGVSVFQEESPRSWSYCEMLAGALRTGQLFSMDEIDWGFMRPRRANDRSMAYSQSEWMIEYIIDRWGRDAVVDLLTAFRDRKTLAAAWNDVLKTNPDAFFGDFKAWAAKQVEKWGLSAAPIEPLEKLKSAARDASDNADAHARLAEAGWHHQDPKLTEKAARKALAIDKDNVLANEILGRLLIAQAESKLQQRDDAGVGELYDEAHRCMRKVRKAQPNNPAALKGLAECETYWKQWDAAEPLWRAYGKRCPDDPASYRARAGIALEADEREAARSMLERYWEMENTDVGVASQIAQMYVESEEWPRAAQWWHRVIQTDAYNADAYMSLGDSLAQQGELVGATRAFEAICALEKENIAALKKAAHAWDERGDAGKADQFRKRAKALSKDADAKADDGF